MTVDIKLSQVLDLAPRALEGYRDAFQNGQAIFDRHGISKTPLRVAHFMAQVLHESGALRITCENLNYRAARLPEVWPSRFKPQGPLDPADYERNPQKLANEVYGGRMGNTDPDDGFKYRGRGLLQLTGRESYQEATRILRAIDPDAPDFIDSPDEVFGAKWCLAIAASEWVEKGCNALADQDSVRKVTKAINGGTIGLEERTKWLTRTKAVWH